MHPARSTLFGLLLVLQTPAWPEGIEPDSELTTPASGSWDAASEGVASGDSGSDEIETVLVTGAQPGPGLWKVTRGDHVMWVFGTIRQVPESLEWRTQELEARIAESQEVLYPGWPRADIDIGVLRGLTLVPAAFKAARNPEKRTLKDVLTPEVYATWVRLRKRFLDDDDDLDRYRPGVAEERLWNAVARQHRPRMDFASVDAVVHKLAPPKPGRTRARTASPPRSTRS